VVGIENSSQYCTPALNTPEQINLQYAAPTAVVVGFVTYEPDDVAYPDSGNIDGSDGGVGGDGGGAVGPPQAILQPVSPPGPAVQVEGKMIVFDRGLCSRSASGIQTVYVKHNITYAISQYQYIPRVC
jgi:hypothetical protein